MKGKELYLFDFDGTLTRKDSLFVFMKFAVPSFYWKVMRSLPNFLLAILGIFSKTIVKERFVSLMLKGKSKEQLRVIAQEFYESGQLPILPDALAYIKNLDADIYIVSASLDIWLIPYANSIGAKLICTEAEYVNDFFTGKFATPNCNYEEKMRRILAELDLTIYTKITAFGNSSGDDAMLSLAEEQYKDLF